MKRKSALYSLWILLLFALSLSPAHSLAAKIEIPGEEELSGFLPAFRLDHSGFALPSDFPLQLSGLDSNAPVLPLFPMFKSQWFAKKFVGIKIPAQYLRQKDRPGRIDNDLLARAEERIASITLEDGQRLVPYVHQGELYGIPENIRVVNVSGETIGLSLSLDFSMQETISLGEQYTLGMDLRIGAPVTYVNGDKGFNAAQSFNDLFHGYDLAKNQESTESIISKALEFMPYLQYYLAKNAFPGMRNSNEPLLPANFHGAVKLPDFAPQPLTEAIPRNALSAELNESLSELDDELSKEANWRKKLEPSVAAELIVSNVEANAFVQQVCDTLAQGYEIPKEVWPRCRIAASWVPNAWAYPGGDIFISAGLIGVLSELDSVALVLSHEIGHVVARHVSRATPYFDAFNYSMFAISYVTNLALTGFSLAGGMGFMGDVTLLTWFPQMLGASIGGGLAGGKALELLSLPPTAALMAYRREDEWQADRFGHEIAFATGANQKELQSGWQDFMDFTRKYLDAKDGFFSQLLADHPKGEDRLQEIRARHQDLSQRLAAFNSRNKASMPDAARYREIHAQFSSSVRKWGETLKKTSTEDGDSRPQAYTLKSFLAPGGRCLQYAIWN